MKKLLKRLCRRFPILGVFLVSVIHPFLFKSERRAYSGKTNGKTNGRKSIVFMTHNRCASVMVHKRLLELLEADSYRHLDFQGLVQLNSSEQKNFILNESNKNLGRFQNVGHYYGPLRYFVEIPKASSLKVLVVLRDPRDVLVSRYYSEKYSHFRFDRKFAEHCKKVEAMNLDEFVIKFSDDVCEHYRKYIRGWSNLGDVLFYKYEDVIADFEGFLTSFSAYAGIVKTKSDIKEIAGKESFSVVKEDKFSHKRSVKSGGFRDKLSQETIEELNGKFEDVLGYFGWGI